MTTPAYWDEAVRCLGRHDPVMADLTARYPERLQRQGDSFRTLVRAVIGQQISIQAAERIWMRLEAMLGEVTPAALLGQDGTALREAGLSRRKIRYLGIAADYWQTRGITDAYWRKRPFADIRGELLQLTGVGPWTVEMFAIFHLHEPDIFSPGDVGLQKVVGRLYFKGSQLSGAELERFARRWRPFRTVAAWYLWRHLDPDPVIY